jgi:hypothetical protein
MKLFEHEVIGGQITFLDRAVIVAFECFAKDVVGLAPQAVQFSGQEPKRRTLLPTWEGKPGFKPSDVDMLPPSEK